MKAQHCGETRDLRCTEASQVFATRAKLVITDVNTGVCGMATQQGRPRIQGRTRIAHLPETRFWLEFQVHDKHTHGLPHYLRIARIARYAERFSSCIAVSRDTKKSKDFCVKFSSCCIARYSDTQRKRHCVSRDTRDTNTPENANCRHLVQCCSMLLHMLQVFEK